MEIYDTIKSATEGVVEGAIAGVVISVATVIVVVVAYIAYFSQLKIVQDKKVQNPTKDSF